MSGIEIVSLIASVASILTAAQAAYDSIKDMSGLPLAFIEVAKRVPLVVQTLKAIEAKAVDAPELTIKALTPVVQSCGENAETLRVILEKLEPGESAWSLDRYLSIIKSRGEKARIEDLMKRILQDVQLLASDQTIRMATAAQMEGLAAALEELKQVEPSAPDELLADRGRINLPGEGIGHQFNQVENNDKTHTGPVNVGRVVNMGVDLPFSTEGRALNVPSRLGDQNTTFLVPFPENHGFIGRSDILKTIRDRLGFGNSQATRQAGVSLLGLGGVGKTQIALAFAYWIRRNRPDVSVFWVCATNKDHFCQAFESLADACKIPGHDDLKSDVPMRVRRWLESEERGRWVMIVDDADHLESFLPTKDTSTGPTDLDSDFLPRCNHGSILITTRNEGPAYRLYEDMSIIKVDRMSEFEAGQLLHSILGDGMSVEETAHLSARLEHLPLAIAQAAELMRQKSMPISECIRLLDESEDSLAETNEVTAVWILTFDRLQRQDPLASEILSLVSLLDQQNIPLEFIAGYYDKRHKILGQGGEVEMTKALGTLEDFSLITHATNGTISIHRLVGLAVRKWLIQEGKFAEFAEYALETVSKIYPYGQQESQQSCRDLLPHAEAVLRNEGTNSKNEQVARASLLLRMTGYFLYCGEWEEAAQRAIECVTLQKKVLGADHPETLKSMANLASAYRNQGRLEEAKAMDVQVMNTSSVTLTEPSIGISSGKTPVRRSAPEALSRTADSGYASMSAASDIGKQANAAAFSLRVESIAEEEVSTDNIDGLAVADTRTDYSMSSDGRTQNAGEYTVGMAKELYCMLPQSIQGDPTIMNKLAITLPDLLKAFALMIGHCPDTSLHREIMYFVHKHRSEIANQFRDYVVEDEDSASPTSTPGMTANEKVDYWDNQASTLTYIDQDEYEDFRYDDEDEPEDEEEMRQTAEKLSARRGCLVNSPAYDWLRNALIRETVLVPAVPDIRHCIRQEVLDSLPPVHVSKRRAAESYHAIFEMDWDPQTFIKMQKYDEPSTDAIGMVITLTASSQDVQALTTSQYLSKAWPSIGEHIIRMIQGVLSGEWEEGHCAVLPDKTTVTARSQDSTFTVIAHGSATSVAELAELLSWLGAALRPSPREQGIVYCTPHIKYLNDRKFKNQVPLTEELHFEIGFTFSEDDAKPPNGQCWHSMFRNPVVVRGYPITKREITETGLEMPLDMMACMVRTEWIVPFGGTYFLKGFSSMLALAELKKDTFLWHHLYDSDGQHISYLDFKSNLTTIPTLQQLESARHIVGWCSEAKFYAGAVDNDVNYNIKNTDLPGPHSTWFLDKISISAGKYVSVAAGIRVGVPQTPIHMPRDNYFAKLNWIAKRFAVMWDEGEDRGWLVNGPSLLLHLALASLDADLRGKLESEILFNKKDLTTPTKPHTADSALEILKSLENRKLKVVLDKDDEWTEGTTDENGTWKEVTKTKKTYIRFEDRVNEIYCLLEQAFENQTAIDGQDGLDLKMRVKEFLEGWEFRDLATREGSIRHQGSIRLRIKDFQTIASGWIEFTREINAITIFGKGFGEIIRPAGAHSVCSFWDQRPSKKYYLAACVSDLKDALGTDFKASEVKVGKRLVWDVPADPFKPCECIVVGTGKVDHSHIIQVLAPQGRKSECVRRTPSQVQLDRNGAVIFGYNRTLPWHRHNKGGLVEQEAQGNGALEPPQREEEFHHSAIGSTSASMTPDGRSVQTEITRATTPIPSGTIPIPTLEVAAAPSGLQGADRSSKATPERRPKQNTQPSDRTNELGRRPGERLRAAIVGSSSPVQQQNMPQATNDGGGNAQGKGRRERFKTGVKSLLGRVNKRWTES